MANKVIDDTNIGRLVSDIKAKADADYWKSSDTEEISLATVATTGDYDDLINKPTVAGGAQIYMGTCATAAATATKTCTVATFPLVNSLPVVGTVIGVKFTNSNTASSPKLDVNGIGAKSIYYNAAAVTSTATTYAGYASRYVYYVWDGTYWCWLSQGTDLNDNTVGYTIRTNATRKTVDGACYRYRLLFTSADGKQWVPANTSTSTSATASKTVNQTKIDPWGPIAYYASSSALSSGGAPSASYLYQQYASLTLGYSFNRTGAALTLTTQCPVWIKAAPQTDGSAIIDSATPYVQSLPSTADGKIYILLGNAIAATTVELLYDHPVYYFADGAIRLWTNAQTGSSFTVDQTYDGTSTNPQSGVAMAGALADKQDVIDSSHKLSYSLLSGTPTIPDELADLAADATHRLVTDTEKSTWNAKSDFSGSYNDLTDKPTIPSAPGTLNTTATSAQSTSSSEALSGNITLHKVSKTGSYDDLNNKPTIPAAQVQSDWNATSGMGVILNKPTIPAAQVNADWNASSGVAQILNKPTIPTVPTISTDISADATSDTKTASPKAVKTFVEGKGYGTYSKPSGGIPASDLASGVIPSVPTISNDIATDATSTIKTASPKAVKDYVDVPIVTSYPSGGFRSNKIYDLGTLTGSNTFSLYTTGLDTTIKNEWVWSFVAGSTAPTITWPSGIMWDGGSAPTVNASCLYEISVRLIGSYYVGYYKEIALS